MRLRERLAYLSEMGVSQWFARRKLLGAAPSCLPGEDPVLTEKEPSAGLKGEVIAGLKPIVTDQNVPEGNKSSTAPTLAQVSDVSNLATESLVAENTSVSSIELPLPNVVAEAPAPLNFNVRAYRAAHVLVTTEGGEAVSVEHEKALLGNILRASGVIVEGVDSLGEFSWPIFHNAKLCQLDGVSEHLLLPRFLENCQDDVSCLHVHFGSALSLIVEEFSRVKSSKSETPYALLCIENSLSELMAMPMLKAKLWRNLSSHLSLFSR